MELRRDASQGDFGIRGVSDGIAELGQIAQAEQRPGYCGALKRSVENWAR